MSGIDGPRKPSGVEIPTALESGYELLDNDTIVPEDNLGRFIDNVNHRKKRLDLF